MCAKLLYSFASRCKDTIWFRQLAEFVVAVVLKMSMGSQKTTSQAIPTTRRITINDAAHMPHDYSTTPGGTLFSTTPGGKCHELADE